MPRLVPLHPTLLTPPVDSMEGGRGRGSRKGGGGAPPHLPSAPSLLGGFDQDDAALEEQDAG